jgi:hypothetical protein
LNPVHAGIYWIDSEGKLVGEFVCVNLNYAKEGGHDVAKNDECMGIFSGCTSGNSTGLEFDSR